MSAPSPVLSSLLASSPLRARRAVSREPIHVWALSAVERVHLDNGGTVILKSAIAPFTGEADVLQYAGRHGVPVPDVLAVSRRDDAHLSMLLEDLGEHPAEDASLPQGAAAAVAIHACPPMGGLPVLDARELASLPGRALGALARLQQAGRWSDAADIRRLLTELAEVAEARSAGAATPPFGMCHSEFHPTSLHTGPSGLRVLDWARAFTGPGLLDLASWRDTPLPLDVAAIAEMIGAYIAAGGPESAAAERGGLPAEVWAGGWHRVWICEWYLQQCVRWMPNPEADEATQRVVRRHLTEAKECLT
ncbi:phosphotransferase [Actinomadura violacea]|uniref:Phosphotransferase n=1 Tax=Actinomadura violacea TaxID=2819934 RepID=A0ABS3S8R1_9ACTN|nr:phosphotransferase [Actinomadura violacea]MBO2465382.1 phosphotransferase [Actinomadura violacea]